jgi:hypothetical protein
MVLLASTYDQSRFLNAEDLPAEKKFRIKEVTEEEVGVGKDRETKLVVWFTNHKKGLLLNKTNNRTLRGAFGNDCSGWKDKIIILFPTTAEFRGKMVPAHAGAHSAAEAGHRKRPRPSSGSEASSC